MKHIEARLGECLREDDVLCRVTDNEFVIVLYGITAVAFSEVHRALASEAERVDDLLLATRTSAERRERLERGLDLLLLLPVDLRLAADLLLHLLELLGGWPGGLIAQQVLRHKTRKLSYQVIFWCIVALHGLAWAEVLRNYAMSRAVMGFVRRMV